MARTLQTPTRTAAAWPLGRLGWRVELAGGLLLLALIGGLGANFLLIRLTSPEAAATGFVQAMAAGDAAATWPAMTVDAAGIKADASLLSQPAWAAFLKHAANRPSGVVSAHSMSTAGDGALVDVAYREGNATKHGTLTLVRDAHQRRYVFYPDWRVVVRPAVIAVHPPAGAGAVAVDGQQLGAQDHTVALFAGTHQIQLSASGLFLASQQTVVAGAGPTAQEVHFQATLTDQAQASAAASLSSTIAGCAKATSLAPANCPQSVIDNIVGTATWTLFGDPKVGTTYGADESGRVTGDGHYQMAVSYRSQYPDRDRHKVVSGPYRAILTWDGHQLSVTSFLGSPTGVAAAQQPAAAADTGFLSAVKGAFDACVAAASRAPIDCPQSVIAVGQIDNFSWKQDSDPMANAKVSFDGNRSLFQVTGSYSMTATFDETYPYQPTYHRVKTDSGNYTADLFWDGQKAVFVTFE